MDRFSRFPINLPAIKSFPRYSLAIKTAVTEAMPPPEQKAELDKENVLMKQWEVVVETPNEDMFRQELPGGEK